MVRKYHYSRVILVFLYILIENMLEVRLEVFNINSPERVAEEKDLSRDSNL